MIYHSNRAGVHRDRLGGVQIDGRLLITGTEVWIVGCPCCLDREKVKIQI